MYDYFATNSLFWLFFSLWLACSLKIVPVASPLFDPLILAVRPLFADWVKVPGTAKKIVFIQHSQPPDAGRANGGQVREARPILPDGRAASRAAPVGGAGGRANSRMMNSEYRSRDFKAAMRERAPPTLPTGPVWRPGGARYERRPPPDAAGRCRVCRGRRRAAQGKRRRRAGCGCEARADATGESAGARRVMAHSAAPRSGGTCDRARPRTL